MTNPRTRARRLISLAMGIVVAAGAITVGTATVAPAPEAAVAAPPASAFDPGEIISDAVMYDFGTMSVAKIQEFLDSKVANCSSSSPAPCLKDFSGSTEKRAGIANRCNNDIAAKTGQSAAQIIYTVARACEVNPQVLLVTLQKEQGLVTRTSVSSAIYRKAMGYGCPDTAACDSEFYGFFNQVYRAARAFNSYANFPAEYPNYKVGTRSVKYTTTASCGSKSVKIKNKATTALYTYTPYTPNDAALNNPYGVGNSCSSYGNRNFWVYFNDWFGSSMTGSYLLSADDENVFLVVGTQRWLVPSDLRSSLTSLGSVGDVSGTYLKSFTKVGTLTNVIRSSSRYILLDSGKLYNFASCAEVEYRGFSCDNVPLFSSEMLAGFPTAVFSKNWSSHVQLANGVEYSLENGVRREILDDEAAADAGITDSPITLRQATLDKVSWGKPILRANVLIKARSGSTNYFLSTANSVLRVDPTLINETSILNWLKADTGYLDHGSLVKVATSATLPAIFETSDVSYAITTGGKVKLKTPEDWLKTVPTLSSTIAANIPATSVSLSAPRFLRKSTTGEIFLVKDAVRRNVASVADRDAIAASMGLTASVYTVPTAVLKAITSDGPMVPAGTVVKVSGSSDKWLIDGLDYRREITFAEMDEVLGSRTVRTVTAATRDAYSTASPIALGATCGGTKYLTLGGKLWPVTDAVADAYSPTFTFRKYDAATCSTMQKYSTKVGTFLKSGSTYYVVEDGKKRALSSAQAAAVKKTDGTAKTVSASFISALPSKAEVVASGEVIRVTGSSLTWIVDGTTRRLVSSAQLKEIYRSPVIRDVTHAGVTQFERVAAVTLGATCGTTKYLTIGGVLYPVTDAIAKRYTPAIGFRAYDAGVCATLTKYSTKAGELIKSGSTYYKVYGGEKTKLTTAQHTKLAAKSDYATRTVSAYFASKLPTAK